MVTALLDEKNFVHDTPTGSRVQPVAFVGVGARGALRVLGYRVGHIREHVSFWLEGGQLSVSEVVVDPVEL